MRSVLVALGPWEWPAVLGIAAALVVVVFLWRKLERVLGEEPAPINAAWFASTALLVAVVAVVLWLGVNKFGPVRIRSWGVMLLCGFTAGIVYASKVGPPRGLTVPMVIDLALMLLIFAILGARLVFVLLMFNEYASQPGTVLSVWRGGLSFHGGVLGGVLAVLLFCRWRKVRFAVLADVFTPAVPIGYALTRIGCFLNGCCHGVPTDLPWGVVFPENVKHFPGPVHPTQLYASAGSAAIVLILLWAWPRMRRPGQLFPLYLVLYSIMRFLCEYTRRGATARISALIPALTVGQIACIIIGLSGLIWFVLVQRQPYENPVTAMVAADADTQGDQGNTDGG